MEKLIEMLGDDSVEPLTALAVFIALIFSTVSIVSAYTIMVNVAGDIGALILSLFLAICAIYVVILLGGY